MKRNQTGQMLQYCEFLCWHSAQVMNGGHQYVTQRMQTLLKQNSDPDWALAQAQKDEWLFVYWLQHCRRI